MLGQYLSGKALQVYSGMTDEDAGNYEKLKEAILYRYDHTEEGFR